MKKELKSSILLADKSADSRPTVGGVNVIAVLPTLLSSSGEESIVSALHRKP